VVPAIEVAQMVQVLGKLHLLQLQILAVVVVVEHL
jgi:hypothetical protein